MSTDQGAPAQPNDYDKQRWKEAERAFDHQAKARQFHAESVDRYALLTIRSVQLASAGGIVAVLGFYGTHYDVLNIVPGKPAELGEILLWLFSSLLATMLAAAASYFSQVCFAAAIEARNTSYAPPYVSDTDQSKRMTEIGNAWRTAAICMMIVAAGLLVAGAYRTLDFLS
jgi:hypothetical protein